MVMDGGVDEELNHLNAAQGVHLQRKESEYSLKSENGILLEPQEGVIPTETEYPEASSHHVLGDILEAKDLNLSLSSSNGLGHPYASPHSMDVSGMVEELTVRHYDNLNMAIVGPSNSSHVIQSRLNPWQKLHTASRYAPGSTLGCRENQEKSLERGSHLDDMACKPVSEMFLQNSPINEQNEAALRLVSSENREPIDNALARGTFRTKILSKSGFSEYFIKGTLKGKGIICRGPPVDNHNVELRTWSNVKIGTSLKIASEGPPNTVGNGHIHAVTDISEMKASLPNYDGISLRSWLDNRNREVNKVERLNMFRQIVDLVDSFHSNEVFLHELRPTFFEILPSNQVKYLGPPEQREFVESVKCRNFSNPSSLIFIKRPSEYDLSHPLSLSTKKQKFNDQINRRQWPQFPSKPPMNAGVSSVCDITPSGSRSCEYDELNKQYDYQRSNIFSKTSAFKQNPTFVNSQLEERWYQSPEELNGSPRSISSNVYSLGVLLFELLGHFDSGSARNAAMMDLLHRILPPRFLSENPKEAGFCLWLLHPDPASRPSSRNILESDVLSCLKDVNTEELTSSIEEDDAESELLSHFLISLKERKQSETSKLVENINCVESDILEIGRRQSIAKLPDHPYLLTDSSDKSFTSLDVIPLVSSVASEKDSRWSGSIDLLEAAYFSMRPRIQPIETYVSRQMDNDLLRNSENWHQPEKSNEQQNTSDQVGAFFDGLCKYARYSKFEVRGVLRNGEFSNTANVICSLSFCRDEDYFAAAGVSKKIKVFEFNGLLNESVDIHYPAVEMSNRSKLSCICWNSYIRNYLASTDYDGVVKLWDVSTGQGFAEYKEHDKRAWSVDFSPACPTKFASGSDDCSVKLWNINERNSVGTIRNIANVCSVQFSAHSSHLLAFGSADYKTYCYDIRNVRSPWCILAGHQKAVSYVRFLDSGTIVTASTDNSLKIWDLNKTSHTDLSTNACRLTLSGHTNEKNFVGLSVADGYISCGSETNEVFVYYKSLPMPITSHKFGSLDLISGKETDDGNGQFVSNVCWKGKSDMLVTANSSGCIKVLQLV
ncbi:hypothetical protein SAY87_029416 [Trapa incisa]|uniref:Protein kinase domain-containing protein n=1 Tax=Trapa incisa TaxID=236973 RepID=A0AAN7K864_9MYRT|nr:hypothetical protein SAY87_029416 [Trapa incisa]